jgi:hypothetical protein
MPEAGDILKVGHWMYDGTVRCRVEIQFSNIRYGSGDHEDDPEWRDDQPGDWFVVSCASPTTPEECLPNWKIAQGLPSLEEAIAYAEHLLRDCKLEWKD